MLEVMKSHIYTHSDSVFLMNTGVHVLLHICSDVGEHPMDSMVQLYNRKIVRRECFQEGR